MSDTSSTVTHEASSGRYTPPTEIIPQDKVRKLRVDGHLGHFMQGSNGVLEEVNPARVGREHGTYWRDRFSGYRTNRSHMPAHYDDTYQFKGQTFHERDVKLVEFADKSGKVPFITVNGMDHEIHPHQIIRDPHLSDRLAGRRYDIPAHPDMAGKAFAHDQVKWFGREGDVRGLIPHVEVNEGGKAVYKAVDPHLIGKETVVAQARAVGGQAVSVAGTGVGMARDAAAHGMTAARSAVPHVTGFAGSALRTGGKGLLFASGAVALGAIGGGMLLERQAGAGMGV